MEVRSTAPPVWMHASRLFFCPPDELSRPRESEGSGPTSGRDPEDLEMMLKDKVAVVYGGGGAIGGASARAFAREGATVFLAGRTREKLEAVAQEIADAGGRADVAVLDALDLDQMTRHARRVVEEAGHIDVALGAVGIVHVQGTPLTELSL